MMDPPSCDPAVAEFVFQNVWYNPLKYQVLNYLCKKIRHHLLSWLVHEWSAFHYTLFYSSFYHWCLVHHNFQRKWLNHLKTVLTEGADDELAAWKSEHIWVCDLPITTHIDVRSKILAMCLSIAAKIPLKNNVGFSIFLLIIVSHVNLSNNNTFVNINQLWHTFHGRFHTEV